LKNAAPAKAVSSKVLSFVFWRYSLTGVLMRKFPASIFDIMFDFFNRAAALRLTAVLMAFCMLFNLTGEAFAQAADFSKFKVDFSKYRYVPPMFAKNNTAKNYIYRMDNKFNTLKAQTFSPYVLTYAQSKQMISAQLKRINKTNNLTESDYQSLYNSYIKGVNAEDAQVGVAYNLLKKEYNLSFVWGDAAKAKSGKICVKNRCIPTVYYMQGALRAELYSAVGIGDAKQYQWNDDIMLARVRDIYYLLSEYGVSLRDTVLLRKYFRTLLARAPKYCENDFHAVDYAPGLAYSISGKSNGKKSDAEQSKARRLEQCRGAGMAAAGLALLDIPQAQKEQDAYLIYEAVKNNYKKDYGAVILSDGMSALVTIGGQKSFGYINDFLFEQSLKDGLQKRTIWQRIWKSLDILSVKAWVDTATNINNRYRGRGGRYLNDVGLKFQYIDEDAARAYGMSNFNIEVAKDNPSLGYNVPYGNIFEDIGYLVGSSQDPYAKALSNKIVNSYAACLKNGKTAYSSVHTPLVTGVLESGSVRTSGASFAADMLNRLDWWDLNEATQRRINNSVSRAYNLPYRSVSQTKIRRADRNNTISELSVWTDMVITAICITALIKSIPSMAKGAGNLISTARRIKAIQAAGKIKLLRTVSGNIKAAGISPAAIKVANYNRRIERAAEAFKNAKKPAIRKPAAPKITPQTAIKKGDYTIERVSPTTASIKFKWQLKNQPSRVLNKTKELTAQVGEGGSSGAAASQVKAFKPEAPIYTGYNGPAAVRPYTPKPVKTVSASRIRTAYVKSTFDYGFGILNQFKRSLKTRFGATLFALNLSLTNPTLINAAQDGKAFAMIENVAGSERAAFASVNSVRTLKSAAPLSAFAQEAAKAPKIVNAAKDIVKPAKVLPDYSIAAKAAALAPLALPKYATLAAANNVGTVSKKTTFAYTLQTQEQAAAVTQKRAEQFTATAVRPQPILRVIKQPVYGMTGNDYILPFVILYTAAKNSLKRSPKTSSETPKAYSDEYKEIGNPASAFFGSNIKLPKGYDKKKGVETYYIDKTGSEVKLPLLFNVDKAIKVNNKQRGVFTKENRLEIRNGVKNPKAIEGFCMMLEPKFKASFIAAIRNASLPLPFKLKLQFENTKADKHFKEVPMRLTNGKGAPYIKLFVPKNIVKDGETLNFGRNGELSATNANGEERALPKDYKVRVPKSEIGNLIKVLNSKAVVSAGKNFVMDIVPTQNKVIPFMLAFLVSTTIVAVSPAFKELFALSDFWANTLMGIISFVPAIITPFLGHFFKKYGVSNVMKAATALSFAGIAMATAAGFYGYAHHGTSLVSLITASIGLFIVSLSNEIKFSSMSPLIESNFEPHKALSLSTKSLMARSLGTILFLEFAPLYNLLGGYLGIPKADDTVAFALFLLPIALAAAIRMGTAKLREVPSLPENNISVKNLIKIISSNKQIRKGAAAFIMFESFEATLSLLLFALAKEHYGPLSSLPNAIGGVAIYAAMVAGRMIASNLQRKGILDGKKTLGLSLAAMALGTTIFTISGISLPGLLGAALAFMGESNAFAPLYNVTSKKNPNKSSEISLIFFGTSSLALISTILLGSIIDMAGSQKAGLIVPLLTVAASIYFSNYILRDLKIFEKLRKKLNLKSKVSKTAKKAESKTEVTSQTKTQDKQNKTPLSE